LLRSYEELIAPDTDYLREILPEEEVNFLTAPRDRPARAANNDLDVDFVFHRITDALLDLESYESGFSAILDLTTVDEESDEDDLDSQPLSKYLRFINDESLCRRLGRIFQLRDEIDLAADCVRRAIQLNPDHTDHYMVLGNLNVTQTNWRDAERAFRRVCELDGNNAPAHRRLAVCCEKLKLLSDAKVAAARAVALAPQNEEFQRYFDRVDKLEAAASASEPA
jgi:tetratricopeptide (TPR) repeat protein